MNIITGYKGTPHITAQQDRDINSAIFTNGVYILNIGSKMAATIVSANEVTIADGLIVAQGCAAEIARGTSESMSIDNGDQGMLRKDLIVLRYTKEASTGVEDMELAVIKGTPAASNPAVPVYTSGSITDGDTLVEFPIYTVNLSGITIQSVTRNVSILEVPSKSYVDGINTTLTNLINTTKTQLQTAINTVSSTLTTVSNRVGTATLNTSAQNALAAINELLTKINTANSNITAANNRIDTTNSNLSTTNSNLSSVTSRTTALETKTEGLVRIRHWSINTGATQYLQLHDVSMYVFICNGAGDNGLRGLYIVGTTGANAIGIKTVSTASSVAVSDAGNGLIKFVNNGYATLRLTAICTYGTSI